MAPKALEAFVIRFEIHKASGGQYYWRAIAANGEVLATSESHYEKASVKSALERLQAEAASAQILDRT